MSTMINKQFVSTRCIGLLLVVLSSGLLPIVSAAGQSIMPTGLQVYTQVDTVYFTWDLIPTTVDAATVTALPQVRFQGYELPMQLFTLRATERTPAALQLTAVTAVDWPGELPAAAALTPPISEGTDEEYANPIAQTALPTTPIFVVRQGWAQGQLITVVAFSPFYAEKGQVKFATHLRAQAMQATLATTTAQSPERSQSALAAQAENTDHADLAPTNPAAARQAIKVIVNQRGLQQIEGSQLAAAGLALTTTDAAKLQITYRGQPLPLHLSGLSDGRLTPTSIVRFYAPTAEDRWNLTTTYWLTVEASNGLRMATRAVAPGNAPVRTVVLEKGTWQDNQLYHSLLAGADGDHWFHKELIFTPNSPPAVTIPLATTLPPTAGSALFQIRSTTRAGDHFTLQLTTAAASQTLSWDSNPNQAVIPDWTHTITMPVPAQGQAQELTLTLADGDTVYGLLLDQIHWQRPAALDLRGQGAAFTGMAGTWRYQWQNAPNTDAADNAGFYDITDPTAPLVLTGATATGFQDGPQARDYLLADSELLHEPTLIAHSPVQFATANGADAVYIAPAEFQSALEPLLTYRRNQGYRVQSINVQTIYDAWSYGQVSADAIRTFLRYARATWQPAPFAIILVGDGTWDPHNYERKAYHTNFIPPYVAQVDPWLGEAACENCYAQLDGANPVTGDALAGEFFAPDLWLGRLPVKSSTELTALVNKLIRYETTPNLADWHNQHLFLADNYVHAVTVDGTPTYDKAGDFAHTADQIIALLPAKAQVERIYYDPFPRLSDPTGQESWRISDAAQTRTQTLHALNKGVGVVVYNGHAQHWQWGRMEAEPAVPGFLSLYDPDTLQNQERFFIALSMTCLTAQFHKPADAGTVLDERQLLTPAGGAIAVWGPAGLSVVQGHDQLQAGFYQQWQAGGTPLIGSLVAAGYARLREQTICCQDTLQTFLLLGDPLTKVSLTTASPIYLPIIYR